MAITSGQIKELREATSCGVIECKKALEEAAGDLGKAKEVLRKRGLEMAAKKSNRAANQGRVEAYIHSGSRIGVLIELNCETDFVAQNQDFARLSRDLAMHIAAVNPKYIKREDVPADILSGQPDPEGYIKEVCLMEQNYVKDPSKTIRDCVNALIASIGENIQIGRFNRYKVGDVE